MIIPMMGFAFALIVSGGLGSLVVMADPSRSRWTPVAFSMFFAGIGALSLSLGLAFIGAEIPGYSLLEGIGFFGGYALGGLGGAVLGRIIAWRRMGRINR